jgi:hypothetical protein
LPGIQWGSRWQPRHCLSASGCPVAEGKVTMADVEVYIDLDGAPRPVGLLRRHASRREETVTFEYDETWLADDQRFLIEPAPGADARCLPTTA